ncbi:MAG TPA: hypothetical protein VKV24_05665 [Casimicrobiaceae bacterium]|nr:hypothetical protein [Casimicrobiaceae bacterium]
MKGERPLFRLTDRTVRRRLARIASLCVLSVALGASHAVDASATGQFATAKLRLDADGAYSFWGKSAGPSRDEVIKVAVSNAQFTDGFFDDFYDREHAIDKIFVDDQAKVVYFEFDADGKYRGLSYFFASGDNCGYCFDSAVRSTVHPENGRLKGKIAFKRANAKPTFDIDLDVPIPSKDRGQVLPAGGGEPGKVYLAYHEALKASDRKRVYAVLDARHKSLWDKYQKEGVDVMEVQWRDFHSSMESVSVTGGFVRGDRAVVLYDGRSKTIDHLHGEALLRRENGVWMMRDELVSTGTR